MARKTDQGVGSHDRLGDELVVRIEPALADLIFFEAPTPTSPHPARQGRSDVFGEAEDLADLANSAARTVADHRGGQRSTTAAVARIDVLDDFLAALMFEIDVDVGRLFALLRDEALEQQVDLIGIDGSDAEHIADGGIGGRTAALAENIAIPGKTNDVVDGEKIGRKLHLADLLKFLLESFANFVGNIAAIAILSARPGQIL